VQLLTGGNTVLQTALTIALGIVFAVIILGVGAALIGAWAEGAGRPSAPRKPYQYDPETQAGLDHAND